MTNPNRNSEYPSGEMDPDPHVGDYSEPLSLSRAREFNAKLNSLMVWDGEENRRLTETERAVLSALYTFANILQDELAKHNNDYSQCLPLVERCKNNLQQANILAEKNKVPFLKQEAEAILKKFNVPEK